MQLSTAASAPFSILYSAVTQQSGTHAGAAVSAVAGTKGATVADLEVGYPELESLPPQGYITGTVNGTDDAVQQAIQAIEELGSIV